MNKKLALGLALSAFAVSAMAGPIEDQIKVRQSAYSFLGYNTGKIKAQVSDHPETYNKEQVIAAANVIAAIANSGLSSLYGPGTEQGTGWKPTRVKPEYFQKTDEIKQIDANLIQEANALQEVAESGDIDAIKAQFGKVGATCKSCHDIARVRE